MLAPILLILAEYGYLPNTYSSTSIFSQIERFINDALEKEELIPGIHKINKLLNIKLGDLEEAPGAFCSILNTNLECKCNLKSCSNYCKDYTWNCKKLGKIEEDLEESEIETSIQEFNTSVNLLENCLDPDFEYPKNLKYCVKCGKTAISTFGKHHFICKSCQLSMNAVTSQAYLLEVRFGRPIKEIINYVIRMWDTIQQQARVLGIRPENLQSICSNYNINMKRYRQVGDSRFINPFLNRKKGRPLIDGYLLRLYSLQLKKFQHLSIREEVRRLENMLISDANQLLYLRELDLFDNPS